MILTQSVFEFRSSRGLVVDLMDNQAKALIISVAKAGEKGLIAYQIQYREITDHLLTLARSIDMMEKAGKLTTSSALSECGSKNITSIQLWNSKGNLERVVYTAEGVNLDPGQTGRKLGPIISGQVNELRLGTFICGSDNLGCLAVAVKRAGGGAVFIAVDSEELLSLRRTFGTGSVIDYLSGSPGIEYAAILKSGTILVASRAFPQNRSDSWLADDTGDSVRTRITRVTDDSAPVFEVAGPFDVAGERYGNIVLGMNTTYLQLISDKLRRDIIWRSILFLFAAVIAISVAMTRQNYRLLAEKYDEIKKDVQRLEADKSQNERLTAMGELASGVAHEIRNPLNAIRVIIQRLQREFKPGEEQEEYEELTGLLIDETDRINNSVKEFLRMAKPPELHKTCGDITDCLTRVVSLIEPRASAKGCTIEKDISKIPEFDFDSELCKQGLLNLLDNALNAIGENGVIKLSARKSGRRCIIEIEDNGPGVPDENKSRVFDMYFTTSDSGTGMGLPTVLRIVKEHKGTIELLDSVMGGALFRLELPIE